MLEVAADRKRAMEFLEIAEKFTALKEKVVSGKKVDILKHDPPLTPALILGYEEKERMESKY